MQRGDSIVSHNANMWCSPTSECLKARERKARPAARLCIARVVPSQGVILIMSKLIRNVPLVNSLEVSPFCVNVIPLCCVLERSPAF